MPNAVIAIEDRRFRSHFGVDPVGLAARRREELDFAGGVVQGGSTLTQQLAKNMFLTPERSLKRKVQEVVLALWLETKYTKDEILEMYLNRVYFGSGAYGIDAAARRYFEREARELTLSQAAMLAGVLPAPSRYAPNRNPEAAQQRAALVLAAMTDERLHHRRRGEERARQSGRRPRRYHMSRSENYIADWVMDVLPYHVGNDRAGRGGGDDRRPRICRSEAEKARHRDARRRRARSTASAKARWWSSTAPARCAPWSADAPMPRASSTAPSTRGASPAPPSSPSSI